jgi:hypothetical protein
MEMPRIKYQEISFRPATLALIETCNRVIAEYERQGFTLTLRQLYYQMVSAAMSSPTACRNTSGWAVHRE